VVTAVDLASLQQLRATFAGLAGAGSATGDSSSSAGFDSMIAAMASANPNANTLGAVSASSGGAFSLSGLLAGSSASGATATGSTSTGAVTGADVVADAEKYIGVPYVLGGESTSGIDCSGLVQKTFADLGVPVTRLVHTQKLEGQAVDGLANAKPGDLIVFKGGGHIGIYAGNGMVIHAPYPGRTVSLQKLWVGDSGIETIRRIVPSGDSSTPASDATPTASSSDASTGPTLADAQAALVSAQQAVMQADLDMMSDSNDSNASNSSTSATGSSTATSGLTDALSSTDTSSAATDASGGTTPDSLSQYVAAQEALMTQGTA
jgi:cell wall-associated NlpC family hydrolase